MMRIFLSAFAAALIAAAPLTAVADAPSYATQSNGYGSGDGQIRGRVVSFDGGYELRVADERGYTDRVRLHPGTIINPTGLTLASGMVVSVLGFNGGNAFTANEIDSPYASYDGGWYYRGHPYAYYGPTIGLSFFFGNGGWWHGPSFGGRYRFDNGYRIYRHVGYGRGFAAGHGYDRERGYDRTRGDAHGYGDRSRGIDRRGNDRPGGHDAHAHS